LYRRRYDIGPAFPRREGGGRVIFDMDFDFPNLRKSNKGEKGVFHFRKSLDKYYTTWKFIKIHRYNYTRICGVGPIVR
jgi:hypothetical protein